MTTGQDQIQSAVRSALLDELDEGDEGRRVCVGLSGGLDSVVLLHALASLRTELSFELTALHVHHGLSPHADSWATFCQTLCATLQIPFAVQRVQLPHASGKGVEQVAREARYAAFTAASGDILCLAHHQNDRAETFLLNLCRGGGATGLAGVPVARWLGQKRLLRPLIDMPRPALKEWALAQQIHWIEDESNDSLVFRRNYVRHRVLPAMAEAFPGVVGVLARTSAQMAEQAELLDRLAEMEANDCRDAAGHLSVVRLQQLPESSVRNILRASLQRAGIQIPAARRLQALSAQVIAASVDSEVFVRMGNVGIHLWRDRLWLDRHMTTPCPAPHGVQPGAEIWPDGTLLTDGLVAVGAVPSVSPSTLMLAPLGSGQRFQPGGRCRDRLSEQLRAQGVPPWVRHRLPGLWLEGRLLWVPYLGWSADVRSSSPSCPLPEMGWQPAAPVYL